MRSHHSAPSLHHQRPTHFLQQPQHTLGGGAAGVAASGETGGAGASPSSQDRAPPLTSNRLRPTRQKTKNAVANISTSGEVCFLLLLLLLLPQVCLEFLKVRGGEERVVDVMRISSDGQRVVVYTPGLSKQEGVAVGAGPPPLPTKVRYLITGTQNSCLGISPCVCDCLVFIVFSPPEMGKFEGVERTDILEAH